MNKLLKVVGVVIAVIVVLTVALVVIANVLITPERVKQTVLPMAEKALHRKIDIGEIKVSLFSGIALHQLKIYEADGRELFIGSDLVRLKYQLLPLLAMKVVIDEVRLEKPEISVIRLANGDFNYSDLTTSEAPTVEQSASVTPQETSGTSLSLLVSKVRLQGGRLVFLDYKLNKTAPYRYEVNDLQLTADGITLTGTVPIKIGCVLNGAQLGIDGKARLQDHAGTFKVTLQNLDVMAFKPYFEERLPGELDSLKLGLNAEIEGSTEILSAKGTLQASDLDLKLAALPEAPLENAHIKVEYGLVVDLSKDHLDVQKGRIDYNGLVAETVGNIVGLTTQPIVDLQLTVPGIELRQAMNSIPSDLVKEVADLDPAGTVSIQASLSGSVDQPEKLLKAAQMTLDKVQATGGGFRPSFNGRIDLAGDQLTSKDLVVRLGDNSADIDLKARNIYDKPIIATADVMSDRFLLDPLFKGTAGAVAVTVEDTDTLKVEKADEIGPFDLPIQASGSLRIGETIWKGLAIKEFIAQYELKNNILTISRMDGQVAGGSFSNKARVDLGTKGLAYDASLAIKAIQADPLLTAFLPKAAGALLGVMNMDLAITGRGTHWETIKKKLTGQGDMLVNDGRVLSPGLVKGFASILQMPDLNEIQFKNFQGAFKVINGKLQVDSSLISDRFKLYPRGTIGLDGSLNLSLDTRLSPETANRLDQKGQVTRFLTDRDGWSQVPLLVSGDFTTPRFGLDPKGVQAQATKVLGQELEKQVDKFFQKKMLQQPTEGAEAPAEQQEEPTQKMIKDSLKNLFGN